MNPFFSSRSDRISDFVENRRAAHCEYFATGAAMLLRLNGVPTRYVTGFTVTQQSASDENDGEMWIARNRDAHAWVEAYDSDRQQWRIVEATPGVDVSRGLWLQRDSRMTNGQQAREASIDSRSSWDYFLEWYGEFSRMMSQVGIWLTNAINALLFCALPWIVWRWIRKSRINSAHYTIRSRARRLKKLDRRLAKIALVREPSETLHQFANRILSTPVDDRGWILEAAAEYRDYAVERYSAA